MASVEKIAEYANALSELLQTTPLERVRVKDICEKCGTDRQNFYYYFKDKFDLAAWIYKLDYTETMANNSNAYSPKQSAEMLERMRAKSDIYTNLFDDTSQNSLFPYMLTMEYELLLQMRAAQEQTEPMSDKEKCEVAFDLAGIFQSIVAWVRGEYAVSPQDLAELQYSMAGKYIKDYYLNCDYIKCSENIM